MCREFTQMLHFILCSSRNLGLIIIHFMYLCTYFPMVQVVLTLKYVSISSTFHTSAMLYLSYETFIVGHQMEI
jgi:hypothetical protein